MLKIKLIAICIIGLTLVNCSDSDIQEKAKKESLEVSKQPTQKEITLEAETYNSTVRKSKNRNPIQEKRRRNV